MQRLILFRHGKAESQSPEGGDFARRLTQPGIDEARSTAQRLNAMSGPPDLALVSPAARTRETWAAAQVALPAAETIYEARLYDAEARDILRLAEEAAPPQASVIVVGHNPGLQELTLELMRRAGAPPQEIGQAMRKFPTSAAAIFHFDAEGRPAFDGLVLPPRAA